MLRRARLADVDAVVRIYRDSRAEAMPWLPVLHTAEEDGHFFRGRMREGEQFWVVERGGRIVGFAGLDGTFLNQLYVDPGVQRSGIGDALFARAKESMPEGFRWWVFQWNDRARRFYEARGGVVVELNDAGGEEQLPDALYEWRPDATAAAGAAPGDVIEAHVFEPRGSAVGAAIALPGQPCASVRSACRRPSTDRAITSRWISLVPS